MGQPEGVSDCVVRTTEASIGKQGPSSQRKRERTETGDGRREKKGEGRREKGEQERNTARARKMGNEARAIRQGR